MTPQELKNSILQLAIQGKLTNQLPADSNVDLAILSMKEKQGKLILDGKLRREGKINKTSDIEIEIPENWRLVNLRNLICKKVDNRGKTPNHSIFLTEQCNIELLEINAIVPGKSIKHDNVEKFISLETYNKLRGFLEPQDILIATVGSIGKFALMDETICGVAQNIIAIKCFEEVDQKYIFYLLQSKYFYLSMGCIKMEAVQASIKVPDLLNLKVPLPPIEEQKRIVAKIEELLPHLDRYEQAWSKLEDFNKRFPTDMQKSILQTAIQGKLVEQRPEEGTGEELYQQIQAEKQKLIKDRKIKKEKPLLEITEDEIPFDIPETWKWVRLRTIVYNRGQEVPSALFSYIDIGSIDNKNQRLNAEDNLIEADKAPSRARKIVELGDILYSTVRPYLHNMCIIDRQFSCKPIASAGFAAMTCYEGIYNKYLFFHLLSPAFDSYANHTENSKGVAYPAINDDRLYRALVPLPPLAEQKRIVGKLEEILPLCEKIKN